MIEKKSGVSNGLPENKPNLLGQSGDKDGKPTNFKRIPADVLDVRSTVGVNTNIGNETGEKVSLDNGLLVCPTQEEAKKSGQTILKELGQVMAVKLYSIYLNATVFTIDDIMGLLEKTKEKPLLQQAVIEKQERLFMKMINNAKSVNELYAIQHRIPSDSSSMQMNKDKLGKLIIEEVSKVNGPDRDYISLLSVLLHKCPPGSEAEKVVIKKFNEIYIKLLEMTRTVAEVLRLRERVSNGSPVVESATKARIEEIVQDKHDR